MQPVVFNLETGRENRGMNISEWATILGVWASGILTSKIGERLVDRFWPKKKHSLTLEYLENLSSLSKVHQAMNTVIQKSSVDRFLLLKGSNGGGIPHPGRPFYSTVIHSVHDDPNYQDLTQIYNKVKVDGEYINMLIRVLSGEVVKFRTEEMTPSLLKNFYKMEGVEYAEIFLLAHSKTEIWFVSIATHNSQNDFQSDKERGIIELAVNEIRNEFAKFSDK